MIEIDSESVTPVEYFLFLKSSGNTDDKSYGGKYGLFIEYHCTYIWCFAQLVSHKSSK